MEFISAGERINDEKVNLMVALSQRREFSASSMLMQHYSDKARHIFFSRLVDDFIRQRDFHETYPGNGWALDFDAFVKRNVFDLRYQIGL